jgi:16S rRNA processing protein RimM
MVASNKSIVPHVLWAAVDPSQVPPDAIEVGRVADAWGVQGSIKIYPYSNDPQAMLAARRWFVAPDASGPKAFAAEGVIKVKEVKRHGSFVVAKVHGIDDRDIAASYRGARIFLPRASFPTPAENEYYWVDLIGLEVGNLEGVVLGHVSDLITNGPQTVMVIHQAQLEGKSLERLIPFVAAFVLDVDLSAKSIRVDWQADY